MSETESAPRVVRRRRRPARINERNLPLQQDVYPEERRSYAEYFVGLGFTGKRLRDAVALAVFISIITTAYIHKP